MTCDRVPARAGLLTVALATSAVLVAACSSGNAEVAPTPPTVPPAAPEGSSTVPTGATTPPHAGGAPAPATIGTDGTGGAAPGSGRDATRGPLWVNRELGRFVDRDGRVVLLTGAHTWRTLQDFGPDVGFEYRFDFGAYLDALEVMHANFFRLWAWEQADGGGWTTGPEYFTPNVYARSDRGRARDGGPAFDLTTFDQRYFDRLRERVSAARDRGIYVAVMIFNGWSIEDKGGPGPGCAGHPYVAGNNVNSVSADLDGDGSCSEVHTLASSEITELQEAYVRQIVAAVNEFDNVVYEISNESPRGSLEWQQHMAELIRSLESELPLQHPVGITAEYPDGDNAGLFASTADWIAPNEQGGYRDDPPPSGPGPAVVLDTDHLWGVGGDGQWVWRAVTRGYDVLYMDCYDYVDEECVGSPDDPERVSAIDALAWAARLSQLLDLSEARPMPERCGGGYCLFDDTGPDRGVMELVLAGDRFALDAGATGPIRVTTLALGATTTESFEVATLDELSYRVDVDMVFVASWTEDGARE